MSTTILRFTIRKSSGHGFLCDISEDRAFRFSMLLSAKKILMRLVRRASDGSTVWFIARGVRKLAQ